MQVKISFTVDLEEVPVRVEKQIIESMHDLRGILDSDIGELTSENALRKIQWIESTRKKLLKIDTKLSDCYSILVGYNKAVADSLVPEKTVEANEQPTSEGPDSHDTTES